MRSGHQPEAPRAHRRPASHRRPGARNRLPRSLWAAPGEACAARVSLAALRPELVHSLHPELNGHLDPYRIGVRSGQKLWWRCRACGHVWSAAPHERSSGGGCPRCAQQKRNALNRRVPPERSLAAKRPDLIAELHPSLNGPLEPGSLGAGSGQSVWWLCRQCGHEWRAAVTDRARGRGCPRCARRRVADASSRRNRRVPPDRSLALKRPDLARELHPTRNGRPRPPVARRVLQPGGLVAVPRMRPRMATRSLRAPSRGQMPRLSWRVMPGDRPPE